MDVPLLAAFFTCGKPRAAQPHQSSQLWLLSAQPDSVFYVSAFTGHFATLTDKAVFAGHGTDARVLKIAFQLNEGVRRNSRRHVRKNDDVAPRLFDGGPLRVFFAESFSGAHQLDAAVGILRRNLVGAVVGAI